MTNQQLTYDEYAGPVTNAMTDTSRGRLAGWIHRLVATGPDPSGVVLRLALAVAIFPHGAQKMLGWFGGAGFAGTVGGFEQYFGIAAPLAVLAILTEFFAPLALATGTFARLAGLALAVDMAVAARFHLANGFFMNWFGNQAGEGVEYHILAIGLALALVLRGAGRWSVDRWLARRLSH